jgi:hypothetical protein
MSELPQDRGAAPDPFAAPDGTNSLPDPSTLLLYWAEAEPPLEEELRLALQREFPDIARIDDLDTSEDMPWGGVFELRDSGMEISLWAERRGSIGLESPELGHAGPEDALVVERARWLIGCEAYLRPQAPLSDLHRQIQVLGAASLIGPAPVYDDNAMHLLPGRRVQELAASPDLPQGSVLHACHHTLGDDGYWVHSHGLQRAGLPDVDLLLVPRRELPAARRLVSLVVESLLAGVRPDERGRFPLTPGRAVRLLPAAEVIDRFPVGIAGGREDREGEEAGDHGEPRLVVLDPERMMRPRQLLRSLEKAPLLRPRAVVEGQARAARAGYGVFGQAFVMMRPRGWRFFARFGFEGRSGTAGREHLWFEVSELRRGELRGRLVSLPHRRHPELASGEAWMPFERLTDWRVSAPEAEFGSEEAFRLQAALDL